MGIAGCQWYLPINGTSTRPHRESSNAAGKPTGQVGTIGIGGLGSGSSFAAGFGSEVTALMTG